MQRHSQALDAIAEKCRREVISRLLSNFTSVCITHPLQPAVATSSSSAEKCEPNPLADDDNKAVQSIIQNFLKSKDVQSTKEASAIETGVAQERGGKDKNANDQKVLHDPDRDLLHDSKTDAKHSCTLPCQSLCIAPIVVDEEATPFSKKVVMVSVLTQTDVADDLRFLSRQHLDNQLSRLQQKHEEQLRLEERLHSQQSQRNIQEAMLAFEQECEMRMHKQMQREMERFQKDVKIEHAMKHRKELDIVRANMEAQHDVNIQNSVTEERARWQREIDRLHDVENLRSREREKALSEFEKQKQTLDLERTMFEAQKNKLSWEEEDVRKRMKAVEVDIREIEKRETSLKQMAESEFQRARDEARKQYEAATESIAAQREFYDKEIRAIQSKYFS